MIAIGNGETCPFCKGKDKFISQPDNDFLEHAIKEHLEDLNKSLFGGQDIGV